MTREEAIKTLKGKAWICCDEKYVKTYEESLDMAIKALEQEPCDDAISRQAAIKIIEREEFQGDALFEIEHLSPVIPQPKAGQWGICEDTDGIRGVYSIPNIKVTTVTPLPEPYKAESEVENDKI